LKTTVGQSPPATNILIKGKNQKLTKSLKRGRGKKAPNQQLGLGEVYQPKTTQKREEAKNWKTQSYMASSQSKMH
jgi:hypothetical protein